MLQRSVTLSRTLVWSRPNRSISGMQGDELIAGSYIEFVSNPSDFSRLCEPDDFPLAPVADFAAKTGLSVSLG